MSEDFMIGADPEFACLNRRGRIENGVRILDAGTNRNYEFGLDGNSKTFELRPRPAYDPLVLVDNIAGILRSHFTSKAGNYEWRALPYISGHTFGGHIHFGVNGLVEYGEYEQFIKSIDARVGTVSMILEDPLLGQRRRAAGYGSRGDYRSQSYGVEQRMCSTWLGSPYTTAAILCLAKVVAYEWIFHKSNMKDRGVAIRSTRTSCLKRILFGKDGIWEEIRTYHLYLKYQKQIDILKTMMDKNLTWHPVADMRETWGLLCTKATKKIYLSDIWGTSINSTTEAT